MVLLDRLLLLLVGRQLAVHSALVYELLVQHLLQLLLVLLLDLHGLLGKVLKPRRDIRVVQLSIHDQRAAHSMHSERHARLRVRQLEELLDVVCRTHEVHALGFGRRRQLHAASTHANRQLRRLVVGPTLLLLRELPKPQRMHELAGDHV